MAFDVFAFLDHSYLCVVLSVRKAAAHLDEKSTADKYSFSYLVLRLFPPPGQLCESDSYFMEHEAAEGVQLPVS